MLYFVTSASSDRPEFIIYIPQPLVDRQTPVLGCMPSWGGKLKQKQKSRAYCAQPTLLCPTPPPREDAPPPRE